ncbi:MAG: hypothetical protein IKZ83_00965, partial [Prevotella sp.]|nr:hypothetical protein [Prevotella sp.]
LEPGKAGPESAVLPLHHTPNFRAANFDPAKLCSADAKIDFATAKVLFFFEPPTFFTVFFIKNIKIEDFLLVFPIKHRTFALWKKQKS